MECYNCGESNQIHKVAGKATGMCVLCLEVNGMECCECGFIWPDEDGEFECGLGDWFCNDCTKRRWKRLEDEARCMEEEYYDQTPHPDMVELDEMVARAEQADEEEDGWWKDQRKDLVEGIWRNYSDDPNEVPF